VTEAAGAAIISGVLSIRMNDDAVRLLGVLGGMAGIEPPGGLAAGLRERLASGIVRRAHVLTWADSQGHAEGAPSFFPDLTGWECADSSFHLEDEVPAAVTLTEESEPRISEDDQRVLLSHGIVFATGFARLVYALDPPGPVRCIITANETNATFRFHQIRPGERWNLPDLDQYRLDKVIEIDTQPATHHLARSPNPDSTSPQAT
jgi:hypothetical protein